MFIVDNVALAILFCVITMAGWGSWANTLGVLWSGRNSGMPRKACAHCSRLCSPVTRLDSY